MRVHEAIEYEIEGGYTVIIEYRPEWTSWVGTVTNPAGRSIAGTIMRDTPEQVMDRAVEVVDRKGG